MRVANGFIRRSVGEAHMVVPVGTRTQAVPGVIALSESGSLLWERLEGGATEEELIDLLCVEYEVDRARAARDVRAFLSELDRFGILEG